jgi:adenylosuccinate lyase
MLVTMNRVMRGLRVFPENMKRNLGITKGAILTEAVMMKMIELIPRAHQIGKPSNSTFNGQPGPSRRSSREPCG